ncbi:hypothetical protein [Polyangium sp. y55x31]|uniref:hypothetical protein n=1 Tax=Polyangium sp. y55x31 TaxID=3042688 RepID=UPI002482CC7F|nr:hypothetical protein [Polyangium sp. y55x31]MDI1476413.1 hypothetical protein [Polyangium sp. y55x31]
MDDLALNAHVPLIAGSPMPLGAVSVTLHRGAIEAWRMNAPKGVVGERLMSDIFTRGVAERGGAPWCALSPDRPGGTGIDGLFVRVGRNGQLHSLMVTEAKFGSSRLGKTLSGLQMSDAWTRPRLATTARLYEDAACAMERGRVLVGAPEGSNSLLVPLGGGHSANVQSTAHGVLVDAPRGVSRHAILKQLQATSSILQRAARGKLAYRTRLFRIEATGDEFNVCIERLDPKTGAPLKITAQFRGSYARLPREIRPLLKGAIRQALVDHGTDPGRAEGLTREVLRNPRVLNQLDLTRARWWRVGFDRGLVLSVLGATASAGGRALMREVGAGGKIDWKPVLRDVGIAALGAGVGYVTARQVQVLLVATPAGRNIASALAVRGASTTAVGALGSAAAGLASSAVVALGLYLSGAIDGRGARVMATAGAAGAVASVALSAGAFATAAAVGTAGTGTAIGTLSGAAFKSAALAWFGCGGGMAVGGAVLTGGAALVGIAASYGVGALSRHLDERAQARLARLSLDVVAAHLGRHPPRFSPR